MKKLEQTILKLSESYLGVIALTAFAMALSFGVATVLTYLIIKT